MGNSGRWLMLIVVLAAFSVWVSLPDTEGLHLDFDNDGVNEIDINVRLSQGLDLVGGLRVLLTAELPPGSFTLEELRQTANNIARRVNALGVTEPTVQVQGSSRILVELPDVDDPDVAINTIRETALLEFVDFSGLRGRENEFVGERILTTEQALILSQREQAPSGEGQPAPLVNPLTNQPFRTIITGADLQAAAAEFNVEWYIRFDIKPESMGLFGDYTAANINQPMAIVLDGVVLSAPIIRDRLDTGGVIEGGFTEQEARQLAIQLRSGTLPIPLRIETSYRVSAELGQESINLSIRAGVIGILVVLTFMLVYYRVPGLAADLALIMFVLLNFAVFKLIPVTLTLEAITGFLISIGTAVDGNILIFERIKEEIRAGKRLDEAIESGFFRAWHSIRDSNTSTIIICAILFFFGQTPGASTVAGFAVTLAIGLIINLFTAVIVTRTFLSVLVTVFRQPIEQRAWLVGA